MNLFRARGPVLSTCLSIAMAVLAGCSDDGAPPAGPAVATAPGPDPVSASPAEPPPRPDVPATAAPVPGNPICDPALAIFAKDPKIDAQGPDDVVAKAQANTTENVWIVDERSCRTYYVTNKYVVRVESLFDAKARFPGQLEAGTVVARRAKATEPWTFDFGARARTLAIIGTSEGQFHMGGFPYGIALGALAVGCTQTYGGAMSTLDLSDTHPDDAKRLKGLWEQHRPGLAWVTVVGHSAGSVAAEDLVHSNGGAGYLYGTPAYTELDLSELGRASAGADYDIRIVNHDGDPVSGSLRCSIDYDACKSFLHRTDASDPDVPSVSCAAAKDPYCLKVLKDLSNSSAWDAHDYSDKTIDDHG